MINNASKHINSADYLRAIASLMVAIFHLGGKTQPILNYGWLGVQLFFVLSGFIICWSLPNDYSIKDIKFFLCKRIIRIEPPYLISILIIIVINCILFENYRPDWANIAMHLAYINSFVNKAYLNPVYWTLGIEFQFYLFIAFFFSLIASKYGKWFLIIIALISNVIPYAEHTIANHYSVFAVGMYCYLYKSLRISLIEFVVFILTLLGIILYYSGISQSIASFMACLILFMPLPKKNIVVFFAKISFSLYLVHDIIGSNLIVYMGKFFEKNLITKAFIFSTGLSISIASAYLFYLFVEKPFLEYSKRIKPGKPSQRKDFIHFTT